MRSHLGERLCPLVDGQLRHDERDLALAHLAHCAPCRTEVAEYRRMKQRVAGLWSPTLPDDLADRLLGLDLTVVATMTGGSGAGGVVARLSALRLGTSPGRRDTRRRPTFAVTGTVVAFGPAPRQRLSTTASLGVPSLFATDHDQARRRSWRRGGRRRLRRVFVGSATLVLLTVTNGAVSGSTTPGNTSMTPGRATVVPSSPLPANNGGRSTPLVTTVSLFSRG